MCEGGEVPVPGPGAGADGTRQSEEVTQPESHSPNAPTGGFQAELTRIRALARTWSATGPGDPAGRDSPGSGPDAALEWAALAQRGLEEMCARHRIPTAALAEAEAAQTQARRDARLLRWARVRESPWDCGAP